MEPIPGVSERPVTAVRNDDATARLGELAALARERDAALAALNAERERTLGAMRQCDYLASEILSERRRHEAHASEILSECRRHEADAAARARELVELDAERIRHTALAADLDARLHHAVATIGNMERSWFWKSRLVWVRIRSLGRVKTSPPSSASRGR